MLNSIRKKIETLMHEDPSSDNSVAGSLLGGLSHLYEGVVKSRTAFYRTSIKRSNSLPCFVISVGNITAGGTGKTPMVIYLAGLITQKGLRTAVVSRGYGGSMSSAGAIVSTGNEILIGADQAGDEPYLIAEKLLDQSVPVIIGSNRYEAGMTAMETFNPDVILLDDCFQHLQLKRDLDILLFDGNKPFGNGRLIPRGMLREPVSAIMRADIHILTRVSNTDKETKTSGFYKTISAHLGSKSDFQPRVLTCDHGPYIAGSMDAGEERLSPLTGGKTNIPVFAFSGIAKNHDFRKTIAETGYILKGYRDYPDHYSYSESDYNDIESQAVNEGAQALITTEKDFVKLSKQYHWKFEVIVIGVAMDFGSETDEFEGFIENALNSI